MTRLWQTVLGTKRNSASRQAQLNVEMLEDRTLCATHALSALPALNSLPIPTGNPADTKILYLDFNGHYQADWSGYTPGQTPAFDLDGDATTFSDRELRVIREVWMRVAEDYAPFNVNVTTVEPPELQSDNVANGRALRVVIGGGCDDWMFPGQPDRTSGWSKAGYYNDLPNVVYVFSRTINRWATRGDFNEGRAINLAAAVATTASHEAGHDYGLNHQRVLDGDTVVNEYDPGTETWTPIMGNNLANDRTTWHNGNNADEMAQLGNVLGFRSDDHVDFLPFRSSTSTKAGLADRSTVVPMGQISGVSGVISTMSDVDFFRFDVTRTGRVTMAVSVSQFGANLDAKLTLWGVNELGYQTVIAVADPDNQLGATITMTLTPGTYHLSVSSHGQYGDVGQYTVALSVPISLRTPNGQLLAALNGGGGLVRANASTLNNNSVLYAIYLGNDLFGRKRVAFQTQGSQFLTIDNLGQLKATSNSLGDREGFSMSRLRTGVAFVAGNGKFLSATGTSGQVIVANSAVITTKQTFVITLL